MVLLRNDGYEALELSANQIPDAPPDGDMTLFHVRPYKETPGFDAATEFVRGVAPTDRRMTVEPWFDESRIKFVVGTPSRGDVEDVVNSHFPNSVVSEMDTTLPEVEPGEYAAGARMELEKDCAYPTRREFDVDPYKTVLPKLIGRDVDRALFQVTFRPVDDSWYNRGMMSVGTDKMAQSRGNGRVVGTIDPEVVQTQTDRTVERHMQEQRPRPGYQAVIRVFAFSPDKREAEQRADAVASILDEEYDHVSDQGLDPVILRDDDLERGLQSAARRTIPRASRVYRWLRGPSNVYTDRQLAGLAHLPSADINVPDVDWARMESGPGTPPGAPQLDFDADGTIQEVSE